MHIHDIQDSSDKFDASSKGSDQDSPTAKVPLDDSMRMNQFALVTLHSAFSVVKDMDDPEHLCGAHLFSAMEGASEEVRLAIKADIKVSLSKQLLGAVVGVLLESIKDHEQRLIDRNNGTPQSHSYSEEQVIGASILKVLGTRVSGCLQEYVGRLSEATRGTYVKQTESLMAKVRRLSPVHDRRAAKPKKDSDIISQVLALYRSANCKLKSLQSQNLAPIAAKFELLTKQLELKTGHTRAKPNASSKHSA